MGVLAGTKIFFSPSLYFNVSVRPSTVAPTCLGKDVHFQGTQAAVGLRHGSDPYEGILLDVCKRRLDQGRDLGLVRDRQLQLGAIARLDHIDGALDALNCAAHANGW